ncbi:hypothetical protein GOP47_0016297 [Adiantum capillus-veneris]|uniref:Uncharacterized protein n=1 Tax=Adiantum capillus-veneris TaxID=13818 RepID=A0A9D4UHU2_ADICA|nr:hypothetical protein GOP47_0016297 [Adiantum capillus-veneris]
MADDGEEGEILIALSRELRRQQHRIRKCRPLQRDPNKLGHAGFDEGLRAPSSAKPLCTRRGCFGLPA